MKGTECMNTKTSFLRAAILGCVMAFSLSAFAGDPAMKMSGKPMPPELKSDMADMYQKMADCMKTDKSMEQCQKDIMKDCPVVSKTGHCPLMEGMKPMMKGMPKMKGMKHPMGDDSMGSGSKANE
jgi:hypothetical protein